MASNKAWLMDEDFLTHQANQYKEAFLEALVENDFITDDQAIEIADNYAIIIKRQGWLGRKWDKLKPGEKTDKDDIQIEIVKKASSK